MKKVFNLLAALAIVMFTSCNNEMNSEMVEVMPDSLCKLSINLAPQFTIEPMTRAITSDLTSLCTNIDVFIINSNSKALIAEVHQVNTDAGFGAVTIGLPTGRY